jgi:hypothetical protein
MKIKSDTYLEVKAVGDAGLWFCVLCCRHTGTVKVKPSIVYCGTEFYFSGTVLMTKERSLHFWRPANGKFQYVWLGFQFQLPNMKPLILPPELSMLMEFTDARHYLNS